MIVEHIILPPWPWATPCGQPNSVCRFAILPSKRPRGCAVCEDAAFSSNIRPLSCRTGLHSVLSCGFCSLERNVMGLLVTEFLWLRILYLRIRDSGTPNCLRGHGPLHVDSRTVCTGLQFCRQNARTGVSFVRIQRIHRTSDPSHAVQFCIHLCPALWNAILWGCW